MGATKKALTPNDIAAIRELVATWGHQDTIVVPARHLDSLLAERETLTEALTAALAEARSVSAEKVAAEYVRVADRSMGDPSHPRVSEARHQAAHSPIHTSSGDVGVLELDQDELKALRARVAELETALRDSAAKLQEGIALAEQLAKEKGEALEKLRAWEDWAPDAERTGVETSSYIDELTARCARLEAALRSIRSECEDERGHSGLATVYQFASAALAEADGEEKG